MTESKSLLREDRNGIDGSESSYANRGREPNRPRPPESVTSTCTST